MKLLHTEELFRYQVTTVDGIELGALSDLYFEERLWLVRYLAIDATRGQWKRGPHERLLLSPERIRKLDRANRYILVNASLEELERAPALDTTRPISREYEESLSSHYGWPRYWVATDPSTASTQAAGYFYTLGNVEIPQLIRSHMRHREGREDSPLRSCKDLEGYAVLSSDLQFSFRVSGFLADPVVWNLPYIVLRTRSWFRGVPRILPNFAVHSVDAVGRNLVAFAPKTAIVNSPPVDPRDADLKQPEIIEHYLIHFRERPEWLETG